MPTIYSNPRVEAIIGNWPIGSNRTTATFRIEVVAGCGQRGTRVTLDPKTGKPNATKKLTYAPVARIVDGDDGRIYIIERTVYGFVNVMRGNMQHHAEIVHVADPRWEPLMLMLDATPNLIEAFRATNRAIMAQRPK